MTARSRGCESAIERQRGIERQPVPSGADTAAESDAERFELMDLPNSSAQNDRVYGPAHR